jgi:hypothetical protein
MKHAVEEVFSETRMRKLESLRTEPVETVAYAPYRHTTLPQDVVGVNGYAGSRLPLPRSARGGTARYRQGVLDWLAALFEPEVATPPGGLLCASILGTTRTITVVLHEDVSGDSPAPMRASWVPESFLADRGIEP